MMDKNDFTSNDVIDAFSANDHIADIIGYVAKVSSNFHSSRPSKFRKIVVNNGQGRSVQVIAWNNETKILQSVSQLGTIVHVGAAKVSAIKDPLYNNGNINFELMLKDNSTVDTYGTYKDESAFSAPEEVSIDEAFSKLNCFISIEGMIKTEPRVHNNNGYECTVGSITDGTYKLEIKFNIESTLDLPIGTRVTIKGVMEKYGNGPPVLKVDAKEHITTTDDDRIPFSDIYAGFKVRGA